MQLREVLRLKDYYLQPKSLYASYVTCTCMLREYLLICFIAILIFDVILITSFEFNCIFYYYTLSRLFYVYLIFK